jgi:23S rRNA (uracil1939-C5)-methyltransferase
MANRNLMEITIEKLIYGGEGLAHHDGSTVFVPFVLPAERVAAATVEQKKKFIRARVERVLEPSPDRAVARCPHFGICGGCDYQHIPYQSQVHYKREILRETLRRIGRIDWPGEIGMHASPPWEYRNRAQWKVRPLGEDAAGGTGIGYFLAGSKALCAVQDCAILSPLLLKTLLALRAAAAQGALPRELREIEAFAGANDTKLLVTATFAGFPKQGQTLSSFLKGILPEVASLLFHDPTRERMELDGPGYVEYEAAGSSYRVGHFSFFQVNRFIVDDLVHQVAESETEGRLALDLFSGVGLFSVALAKRFPRVIAVESNPAAARDLEANVSGRAAPGGRGVEVRATDVEPFLAKLKDRPDLVVLDPPRAGLEPGIVQHLARLSPPRITYVSCDPPTLARDLAALLSKGYEISRVHLFDLFPQTFHMEAVIGLRRRP